MTPQALPLDPPAPTSGNAENLAQTLEFLTLLIAARVAEATEAPDIPPLPQPALLRDGSPFAQFLHDQAPKYDAFTILALALAPHVRPGLLEKAFRDTLKRDGDFPEIGGLRDDASRAFMPTGETAAYLLAGDDLDARFEVQRLLDPQGWLATIAMVRLEPPRPGAPILSGRLVIGAEMVQRLTTGQSSAPAFGPDFPAQHITTGLTWADLVLSDTVRGQLIEIQNWIDHAAAFRSQWGMQNRLRPGYRALFHGPPGTGKTLTATLIGQATGRDVYRVDLSAVVSKYIGETEKNLGTLFDRAARRNWVLFFDEADALFGKRTQVKDSHDRYANQEVSYLLQRVEDHDGLVILASNMRANIDEAFLRRFNTIVRFSNPDAAERAEIWRRSLPDRPTHAELAGDLAVYDLSGGNIVNVVQQAGIAALARGASAIGMQDALHAIAAEMEKEGRVFHDLNKQHNG